MDEKTASYQVELEFSNTQTYQEILIELLLEQAQKFDLDPPPV